MSRAKLIKQLKEKNPQLNQLELENVINIFTNSLLKALKDGKSVEIREFGRWYIKKIKENFMERSKTAYERDLSDALIDKVNPSFAPSMVEHYLTNLVDDVKKQNNGEPLDDEKVREHYMPLAERNVKWYSLRNKLIDHGNLEVSKTDVENEIQRLIDSTPSSQNEIRKFYKKPSNQKRLEDGLMEKIILEYLEQFAKVKEVEVQTKDLRGQEHEH